MVSHRHTDGVTGASEARFPGHNSAALSVKPANFLAAKISRFGACHTSMCSDSPPCADPGRSIAPSDRQPAGVGTVVNCQHRISENNAELPALLSRCKLVYPTSAAGNAPIPGSNTCTQQTGKRLATGFYSQEHRCEK